MVPLDLAGVLIGPRGTGKGCGHGIFRCQPRHRAGRRLGTVFAKLFEDIQEMEKAASKNVDHRRRNGGYLFLPVT